MKGRMNVDADALAESFRIKMESGQENTITGRRSFSGGSRGDSND